MKKKRLLIIPAKGFSKRVKNKNIKKFFSKPIIYYSLKTALDSKLFDKIHVSTESQRVKKIVEKNGFVIDFMREKKLTGKNIPIIDVLKFVLKKYKSLGCNYDEVWMLSACAPLINKNDLIKAAKKVKKNKILISVTKYGAPIEWVFSMNKLNELSPFFVNKLNENSQNFKTQYHDSGSFAVFPSKIIDSKKINQKNIYLGYELPRHRAVDIDNIDDWELTKKLYRLKKYIN